MNELPDNNIFGPAAGGYIRQELICWICGSICESIHPFETRHESKECDSCGYMAMYPEVNNDN